MRVVIIAPLPTKTRANVPMKSAAKCRHAARIDVSPKVYGGAAARPERSLDHPTQYQRGVDSAEAEGIRQHVLDALLPPGTRQKIKIAGFVRNLKVYGGRQPFVLHRQRTNRRLDGAGCAEGMSVVALGPTHRNSVGAITQHLLDRHRFRRIVERSGAAMRVDVTDFVGCDVRILQ